MPIILKNTIPHLAAHFAFRGQNDILECILSENEILLRKRYRMTNPVEMNAIARSYSLESDHFYVMLTGQQKRLIDLVTVDAIPCLPLQENHVLLIVALHYSLALQKAERERVKLSDTCL